jgi:hypothetical protein
LISIIIDDRLFGISLPPFLGHQNTSLSIPLLIDDCAFGGLHGIEFDIGGADIEIGNFRHPPLYPRPLLPIDNRN